VKSARSFATPFKLISRIAITTATNFTVIRSSTTRLPELIPHFDQSDSLCLARYLWRQLRKAQKQAK
jgi:hypothetical protein